MATLEQLKANLEAVQEGWQSSVRRVIYADGRSIEYKSDLALARVERRIKDEIAKLENRPRTRVVRVNSDKAVS